MLLYRPSNLGAALQNIAQELVQITFEELIELDKLEITQNLAQDAIDFAQTSTRHRSFDGGQRPGGRLQTEMNRARETRV